MTSDIRHTPSLEPRAVIWDVDGTLIDSLALHYASWEDTLRERDFTLTHERFTASFGQRNDAVLRGFFGPDLAEAEAERIAADKEQRYRAMVQRDGVQALPGVRAWIERLREQGWRQAIASSAPRANLDAILDVLGVHDIFAVVVSADDVAHGKPDPEIFLRAASRLGVSPRRCVVVEDAPAGLDGARRAGMHTVGVLTSHAALDADIVVPLLSDLPADTFERLVPPAA